jgi:hypothetical protein
VIWDRLDVVAGAACWSVALGITITWATWLIHRD